MATKKLPHSPHLLHAAVEVAMQSLAAAGAQDNGEVQASIVAHHEKYETVDEAKARIGKELKAKAKK